MNEAIQDKCQAAEANAPKYQPYRHGSSGIVGIDPRIGCDSFELSLPPGIDRPGAIITIKTSFFADAQAVAPALSRGRRRFDVFVAAVRAELIGTPEHAAYADAAKRIKAATAKAATLPDRIAAAQKVRDDLLTGDDDAKYAEADREAAAFTELLSRLQAEGRRLGSELPDLELALLATANHVAVRRSTEIQEHLAPDLDSLCGLLDRNASDALDRVIELSTARDAIRGQTRQTAQSIVMQIVAEHAVPDLSPPARQHVAAPSITGPVLAGVIGLAS